MLACIVLFLLDGAVAQLGERRVRNAKVGSSILLRSTNTYLSIVPAAPRNPALSRLAGFSFVGLYLG